MHVSKTAIWHETGLKIHTGVISSGDFWPDKRSRLPVYFECLNPQVEFTHVFTRWELVRFAMWFLKRAIIPPVAAISAMKGKPDG